MLSLFKCPKCGKVCELAGSVDEPGTGRHLDIFQCENEACDVTLDLDGQAFPAAYTFAVGSDGIAFDPAESMESIDD